MDRFTFALLILEHRKKIILAAHLLVIANIVLIGWSVYDGDFKVYMLWSMVVALVNLVMTQLQLGDD